MLALHRWIGLALGLLLLFSGLTGAVLVFMDEVDRALNPSLLTVAPGAASLPLDTLVARVREAAPGCAVTDVVLATVREPGRALLMRLVCDGRLREAAVNPYTGVVLGLRDDTHVVRALFTAHSSLFLGDWGRLVLFAAGIGLIVLGISGLSSHARLRASLRQPIRRHLGTRVFVGDVHRLAGLLAVVFNLVIGASGAWLTWGAVARLIAGGGPRSLAATPARPIALDRALASAARAVPGLEVNWIAFPRNETAPLGFWGRVPDAALYGPFGTIVNLDPDTGEVRSTSDVRTGNWRARATALAVSFHFGNFGGLPVKLLWSTAALLSPLLAGSGALIWWMRRSRGSSRVGLRAAAAAARK